MKSGRRQCLARSIADRRSKALWLGAMILGACSITPSFCTPVESPHTWGGAPFLLYSNPAFIYLQPEAPIGIEAAYSTESAPIEARAAFSKSTGHSGFAVGYDAIPADKNHRVSFVGSQLLGPIALATDIDLIAAESFNAAVGISAGHAFYGKQFISLNLYDIAVTDATIAGREPGVGGAAAIVIAEKLNICSDLYAGVRFVQPRHQKYGYRMGAEVQADFFKNHTLIAYAGGHGELRPYQENIAAIDGGLGSSIRAGISVISLNAGYSYDYYKTASAVHVSLTINPTFSKDRAGPSVSVAAVDSVLLLTAPPEKQFIPLVLTSKDGESGSGIIKWVLIISRDYDGHAVVRAYSGGGPAPALIRWDGRASNGAMVEPGVYFARLSAVDSKKNTGESQPVRMTVGN